MVGHAGGISAPASIDYGFLGVRKLLHLDRVTLTVFSAHRFFGNCGKKKFGGLKMFYY
jgi:hypothetical protein